MQDGISRVSGQGTVMPRTRATFTRSTHLACSEGVRPIEEDLAALIQAACQLLENPALGASAGGPFHRYLHVVQSIQRRGEIEVLISTRVPVIGSRMVIGNPPA
jgi:hypothetical protein